MAHLSLRLRFCQVSAMRRETGKRNEGICKGMILIMGHGINLDKIISQDLKEWGKVKTWWDVWMCLKNYWNWATSCKASPRYYKQRDFIDVVNRVELLVMTKSSIWRWEWVTEETQRPKSLEVRRPWNREARVSERSVTMGIVTFSGILLGLLLKNVTANLQFPL